MAPAKKKQRLSNGSAVAVEEVKEDVDAATAAPTTAEQQKEAVQQRRSLFVRSLPASTTTDSLTELFSDAFPVKHATAVTDPETKQCRGYGFVTFADAEDAARAKEQFNNHVLDGKKLRVEIADPRQRKGEGEKPGEKQKEEREQQLPPKLIVRNLPWSIKGSEQLTKLFQSYGKVKQAYVPKKGPGLMAGFGFVIMRGKKNAEKAIEGVNGKEVDGRTLAVDWAVEKNVYEGEAKEQDQEDDVSAVADDVDEDLMSGEDEASDGHEEDEEEGSEDDEDDEHEEEDGESEGGVEVDLGDHEHKTDRMNDDTSATLFIRNLPFTCTDEDLEDHFQQFGNTRYARVVMDHGTERSKGTGFVAFYNKEDADACVRNAPIRPTAAAGPEKSKDGKPAIPSHSILQNDMADPTGQYTLDGRVLQVSKAVNKHEANRLTEEGVNHRHKRDNDKRRLYLLGEGTISHKSKLWEQLPPSEQAMREASAKQRKQLIESNPSLNLSLTRLSVRNLPRSVTSKDLKDLARQAVVGFATDVKEGKREKLSRDELARSSEEMQAAEAFRKRTGKGIVKQAKVVFESGGGTKISEETGAGRSRGYGFIEYYTHRNALMGLRWLNGHAIDYKVKEQESKGKLNREEIQDRKKRLIVEFAIENAQVVHRRNEQEAKARARGQAFKQGLPVEEESNDHKDSRKGKSKNDKHDSRKRKRDSDAASKSDKAKDEPKKPIDEKLAKRNQIIGRKRAARRNRKGGKA